MASGPGERAPTRDHLGWQLYESGPEGADHAVLLLPGALCTAAFYDDLIAEPALRRASVRFEATTLPGFGGTEPLDDLSFENYARTAGKIAADLGCDAVVGHSLGANVALEMVATGAFKGPIVLLSPSLSREDESKFPRALDVSKPALRFTSCVLRGHSVCHEISHCHVEMKPQLIVDRALDTLARARDVQQPANPVDMRHLSRREARCSGRRAMLEAPATSSQSPRRRSAPR